MQKFSAADTRMAIIDMLPLAACMALEKNELSAKYR